MRIWRELLRLWLELLYQSSHAAIDAMHFDRQQASGHYPQCCNQEIQTLQTTCLVDTAQDAVIDVHYSTKWPNGTKIGPQVARQSAEQLA